MEKDRFSEMADRIIASVAEQVEEQDSEYKIEIDMLGDILSIKTSLGEYILNKHSAAREVWLASPISGPYHFAYANGRWINKKGIDLLMLLSGELSRFTKIDLI